MCVTPFPLYVGDSDLTTGPHPYTTDTLLTELFPGSFANYKNYHLAIESGRPVICSLACPDLKLTILLPHSLLLGLQAGATVFGLLAKLLTQFLQQ